MPPLFAGQGFHIGDVLLTWHRFITIVVAVALAIGLRILLFRTRLGVAMRAVVDNRELAALARRALGACSRASRGRSAARSPRSPASSSRPRPPTCRPTAADAADHHRVRGRGRRPAAQPAAHLPRRADPRARRSQWSQSFLKFAGALGERARRAARRSCCSSCCCCCRRPSSSSRASARSGASSASRRCATP